MIKRPFLIFSCVIGALVIGVIGFIQSAEFARLVKGVVAKRLPTDIGIEGDFYEFAVKLFPPGVSIRNPSVKLGKRNILNLPGGSVIRAERIDLNFQPFQMLSGEIRVNEVVIVKGDVQLTLDDSALTKTKEAKKKSKLLNWEFHWDELLKVRADFIALQDSRLRVNWVNREITTDLVAHTLRFGRSSSSGLITYELGVELKDMEFQRKKEPPITIERLSTHALIDPSGVRIDDLSVLSRGVTAQGTGSIKGDILSPKALTADAELNLKGDVAQIGSLLFGEKKNPLKTGQGFVTAAAKIKSNLDRPMETLHVEGSLSGEKVKLLEWEADKIDVQGSWAAASNEISVTKAAVMAAERKRVGGFQPGHGGRIEVGAFKLRLGVREPVSIPVKFERAHMDWLGAPQLRKVYPLDCRVTGPVEVIFIPASERRPWSASAKLDLRLEEFQVDNQKIGINKPLRVVLKVPSMQLSGGVVVDPSGLQPNGLILSLPHSKVAFTGKVDSNTGFDLSAAGPVNLADIGILGPQEIRGEGTLAAHLHGPTTRLLIDFDVDLKNGFYVHQNLGTVKGRVTYDEDPNDIFIRGLQAVQGQTSYTVNGSVNVGATDIIDITADLPDARVQDVITVVHDLVKDVSWFPDSMTGQVAGKVKIGGKTGLDELEIKAPLVGHNVEYLGEKFKSITLNGGYDKGSYYAQDIQAIKRTGTLSGGISYDKNGRFDWKLNSENLVLSDMDHLARLDVPIRGQVTVQSSGQGKIGTIDSNTQIKLSSLVVRGIPNQPSEMQLKSANGVANLHANAFGGQGVFDALYDFKPGGNSYIRGEARRLDFSPILLLLNTKSLQDTNLVGYISGAVDLNFKSGDIEHASGNLSLTEYLLSRTGARFSLSSPVDFKVDNGSFDLKELALRGSSGEARLALRGRNAVLEGSVTGDLDTSITEFLTSTISDATGVASLDFEIGGTIKKPTIFGKAILNGALFRTPSLDSPFEGVTGVILLKQGLVTVQSLEADLASGRVSSEGTIELFPDRYPLIALNADFSENKLKIYPFQFLKIKSGRLKIHGDKIPYRIDGSVIVDSGLSKEKLSGNATGGLKSARYTPPPTSQREGDAPKFKLNIEVVADRELIFDNDMVNAEMKANITLVNTLEAPRMMGTAELIQGKLNFKDRAFQLQTVSINFDSPTVMNPSFTVVGVTDVGGTKIQLYVAGRLDKFKAEFSSNPVLPESEILSLLALGYTTEDVKRLRGTNLSAVQQGEAASLILHSLDFHRDVENKTGLQIQLQQSVDTLSGTSVFRPQTDADTTSAPKIVIKRQVGKKLDLSVGSTVGVGTNSSKEVNAEYHVTPGFSLQGVWSNTQDQVTTQERSSYGADLKLQTRFK